jgi:molecular chaperone HscB
VNYFEVFGLPRLLQLDLKSLEKSFHELSRKHHPDYFVAAAEEDRQRALKMTALLNDAYRTLRHPIPRVEYLLEVEGLKADGSTVPKEFLMEIFEINEQVEEAKSGRATPEEVLKVRRTVEEKGASFDALLETASREWDSLVKSGAPQPALRNQLEKLKEILSESSYIRNLKRELEEAS